MTTAISKQKFPVIIVLWSGLLVGTLDALAAVIQTCLMFKRDPQFVLKYVASGYFGKEALKGGVDMTLWGLFFHFVIAYACTSVFFWLYPRVKLMAKSKIATGVIYALLVWIVTNLIIVQLSNTPKGHFHLKNVIIGMAILIVMIGLPLAFIADNYYSKRQTIH